MDEESFDGEQVAWDRLCEKVCLETGGHPEESGDDVLKACECSEYFDEWDEEFEDEEEWDDWEE